MMGGGLCWLDYDGDGWLDLFVVNSHADVDIVPSETKGGLPRSRLYRNIGGRFEDVSADAGVDIPVRGNGCVAADLNQDGHTDLYVTSAGYNVSTDGWDALLWNNGDGTFTEGAVRAGIMARGWHSAAAVGDVNGDGRPDLFVTSYSDPNFVVDSAAGFPSSHAPVRDLLYLNQGPDESGRSTFREVARAAGIEKTGVSHGLGSVFTDMDGDGRLDLYVANDTDPNQLYRNTATTADLGFRFEDVAKRLAVDDPNAGMGIAAADYSGDGRVDLFVTNSRHQLHAAYRSPRSTRASVPGRSSGHRRRHRHRLDGMGRLMGRPRPRRRPRPRTRERRDSRREPRQGRAARSDPRERRWAWQGALDSRWSRQPGSLERLASTDEAWRRRTTTTTATSTSRSTRSAASSSCSETTHRSATGWRFGFRRFAPGAVVTATLADGRKLVREVQAGSSYLSSEDPRVHFGLGKHSVGRAAHDPVPRRHHDSSSRTSRPTGSSTSASDRAAQRPERSCSLRATVSSVTASEQDDRR